MSSNPTPAGTSNGAEPAARRPRPLVVRLVVPAVLLLGVSALGGVMSGAAANPILGILAGLAMAVLSITVYRLSARWLDRRRADELAREGAAGRVGRGLLIGIAACSATVGLIALTGGYQVLGFGSAGGAIGILGLTVGVAVTEELLFRGVLFRIVEGRLGTWGALVVTGVLFGGLHLVNPDASVVGALAIAVEAGLMLGAAYVATRTLWLPIGLHLGWNAMLGGFFGATVSGADSTPGLLQGVLTGPDLLTGGAFGPEASLFAVLVCAVPAVLFLRRAHSRGLIVFRRPRQAWASATSEGSAGGGGTWAARLRSR
jgi:membrane protease YdiL (CAAX protease family)